VDRIEEGIKVSEVLKEKAWEKGTGGQARVEVEQKKKPQKKLGQNGFNAET